MKLTEKQLVDLIPEEHRELFLYVCSRIHIDIMKKQSQK